MERKLFFKGIFETNNYTDNYDKCYNHSQGDTRRIWFSKTKKDFLQETDE